MCVWGGGGGRGFQACDCKRWFHAFSLRVIMCAGDVDKPQVTRRKKKKPVETVENGNTTGEGDKPQVTRRKKEKRKKKPVETCKVRNSSWQKMSGADGDGNEDATVTTPKKKKRKPKPKPEGGDQAEEAPVSDRSAVNMPWESRFFYRFFFLSPISFGCNAAFIHVWSGIIICSKQSGTL